jgi:hypothetical protein
MGKGMKVGNGIGSEPCVALRFWILDIGGPVYYVQMQRVQPSSVNGLNASQLLHRAMQQRRKPRAGKFIS